MAAALYTKSGPHYHANVDCYRPLRVRGMVGDSSFLRARGLKPCERCWGIDGYTPQREPEIWELA